MLSALHVPGVLEPLEGDIRFLDTEIPSTNAVLTARALATTAQLPTGAESTAGRRSYRPGANVGMPMSFHLGYHGTSIPGLLPGSGHSGLGGSVGWADRAADASFGFIHNRFITRMVFDQASFAGLAPLLRRAVTNAAHSRGTSTPIPETRLHSRLREAFCEKWSGTAARHSQRCRIGPPEWA